MVDASRAKNSRHTGSQDQDFALREACGVLWGEGLARSTTEAMREMAVVRSERSRKAGVQGMAVGVVWGGCHWERDVRVCWRVVRRAERLSR